MHTKPKQKKHTQPTALGTFSPQVAVRERRKFVEVMDEEIDDEKKGLQTRSTPMRLLREIGTGGYAYGQIHTLKQEARVQMSGKPASMMTAAKLIPPMFREKIRDTVVREDEEAVFSVLSIGDPMPTYTWFRNDGVLVESQRIEITKTAEGRCGLRLKPTRAYDVGCFKCVARNDHGAVVCRAKLKLGTTPGRPEPPVAPDTSDSQAYLTWSPPRQDGNSPIMCYSIEYQTATDETWTNGGDKIGQEFFLLRGLNAGSSYLIRIRAKNKFGWSEWSFPSNFIKTKAADAENAKLINVPKFRRAQASCSDAPEERELALVPDLDYKTETHPVNLAQGELSELFDVGPEIARGRFSAITAGTLKSTGQRVALKAALTESQAESGINREFEVLKTLAHEKIVKLVAATSGPTLTVLGLEPLSGLDVMTVLSQRGQYSEDLVAKVVQDVLDALDYLHWRGICLLELQPDNVVAITPRRMDFKIVDLSTARYVPAMGGRVGDIHGETEYICKCNSNPFDQ